MEARERLATAARRCQLPREQRLIWLRRLSACAVVAQVFAVPAQVALVLVDVTLVLVAILAVGGQVSSVFVDVALILVAVDTIGVQVLAVGLGLSAVDAIFRVILAQVELVFVYVALIFFAVDAVLVQIPAILIDIVLISVAGGGMPRQVLPVLATVFLVAEDVLLLRGRIRALRIGTAGKQSGNAEHEHTSSQ